MSFWSTLLGGPPQGDPWQCVTSYMDGSAGVVSFWAVDERDALRLTLAMLPVRPMGVVRMEIAPLPRPSDDKAR